MKKTTSTKGKQSLKNNNTLKNEAQFFELLSIADLPLPAKEVIMIQGRRYRVDYAWASMRLGIEIQGGVFTRGAHGSIYGILQGYKKSNDAAQHGWTLMYYLPSEMLKPETIIAIKKAFEWKLENG
jgi:hypothetical protein